MIVIRIRITMSVVAATVASYKVVYDLGAHVCSQSAEMTL